MSDSLYLHYHDLDFAPSGSMAAHAHYDEVFGPKRIGEYGFEIEPYYLDHGLLSDAALPSSDDSGASSRSSESPTRESSPALVAAQQHLDVVSPKRPWDQLKDDLVFNHGIEYRSEWEDDEANTSVHQHQESPADAAPPSITLPTLIHAMPSSSSSRKRAHVDEIDDDEADAEDASDDSDYDPDYENTNGKRRRGYSSSSSVVVKKRKVGTKASSSRSVPTSTARRSSKAWASSASAYPIASTSTSTSDTRPTSRNDQVVDPVTRSKLLRLLSCTASTMYDWTCPACDWEQNNHRMPDFKRHLKTHLRADTEANHGHFCEGVPLEKAHLYDIPEDAHAYEFQGRMMIGGCRKSFSRRDARKRHFKKNNACVQYRGD